MTGPVSEDRSSSPRPTAWSPVPHQDGRRARASRGSWMAWRSPSPARWPTHSPNPGPSACRRRGRPGRQHVPGRRGRRSAVLRAALGQALWVPRTVSRGLISDFVSAGVLTQRRRPATRCPTQDRSVRRGAPDRGRARPWRQADRAPRIGLSTAGRGCVRRRRPGSGPRAGRANSCRQPRQPARAVARANVPGPRGP